MRPHPRAVATALLAGIAGVAGSYFVTGLSVGFVGAPVESALAWLLPGEVLTLAITGMGDLAQPLAFGTAVVLVVLLYAAGALLAIEVGRRGASIFRPALLAGLAGIVLTLALTGRIVSPFAAGLAMFATVAVASNFRSPYDRNFAPSRRRLLGAAAGVAGLSAGAYLARRGGPDFELRPLDLDEAQRSAVEAGLAEADEQSLVMDGLESLVSEQFYEVDINSINPTVDAATWSLSVTGSVENEFDRTFDDLRSGAVEHRFVTLRCVGEALNGRKMDTALWTGVPIAPLVEEASPIGGCECVRLHAADDYYQVFPVEALRRGFLAFGMNGEALPVRHGYPVRTLIPGHWGEINVKWLTEIEFLDRAADGYWEERGWHGTGPVNTVAKLHAVDRHAGGARVGGHAYAGLRGISAVEVSVDGGDTWEEATLSEPLPGEDVWRQWTHALDVDRETDVTVRAIEADGTVQPEEHAEAFPSGPSGWVTRTV